MSPITRVVKLVPRGRDEARARHPEDSPKSASVPARRAAAVPDTAWDTLQLVRRVFLDPAQNGQAPRSVVFSTFSPEDSPEVGAAAAAMLAAHTGQSVCVVDANTERPMLHRRFGVENTPGLSDTLVDRYPLSATTVRVAPRLWLVPAGTRRVGEEVSAERVREVLTPLHSTFGFVVFAGCVSIERPWGALLASLVDGTVLVVDRDRTRRQEAIDRLAALQAVKAHVLGTVLRTPPVSKSVLTWAKALVGRG